MADHQLGVHHLDVAGRGDHARGDLGRAGRRKLEALGPLALHAQRDLLDVEHDVGDILANAGQRREFVQHVLDLDRGHRRTLQRREQHATQRVAERQAEATLERLGDEGRPALAVAAGLLLETMRLLQFLPIFGVDGHMSSLKGWAGGDASAPGRIEGATGIGRAGKIRRGGASTGARRCAGSRSRRGSR